MSVSILEFQESFPADELGNTQFHVLASRQGATRAQKAADLESIKALSQFNAAINRPNNHGWTAAMLAAHNKNWDIVEYLVSQGSDIFYKGKGSTLASVYELCLDYIDHKQVNGGHRIAIEQLHRGLETARVAAPIPWARLHLRDLQHALFTASRYADIPVLTLIVVDRKFAVDCADGHGNTALHKVAADKVRGLATLEFLVAQQGAAGASLVNIINHAKETPAHLAAKAKNWVFLNRILALGANAEVKDGLNKSVVDYGNINDEGKTCVSSGIASKPKELNIPVKLAPKWDETALEPVLPSHGPQKSLPLPRETNSVKLSNQLRSTLIQDAEVAEKKFIASPRDGVQKDSGLASPRAGPALNRAPSFSFGNPTSPRGPRKDSVSSANKEAQA